MSNGRDNTKMVPSESAFSRENGFSKKTPESGKMFISTTKGVADSRLMVRGRPHMPASRSIQTNLYMMD